MRNILTSKSPDIFCNAVLSESSRKTERSSESTTAKNNRRRGRSAKENNENETSVPKSYPVSTFSDSPSKMEVLFDQPHSNHLTTRTWNTLRYNYSFRRRRSNLNDVGERIHSRTMSNVQGNNSIPPRSSNEMSSTMHTSTTVSILAPGIVRKNRKAVTFAEHQNIVIKSDPNMILDDEHIQQSWWSIKDRIRFVRKRDREIQQLLTNELHQSYCHAVLTLCTYCQEHTGRRRPATKATAAACLRNTTVYASNDTITIDVVHKAIGVLVKSRFRGLERIVCKALQIQLQQVPTKMARGMEATSRKNNIVEEKKWYVSHPHRHLTIENSSAICIRKCILDYQTQLLSREHCNIQFVGLHRCASSRDDCDNHYQYDDPCVILSTYCRSLEQRMQSILWAQLMAMGDTAVVVAGTNRGS
jgi:hypothetical protein